MHTHRQQPDTTPVKKFDKAIRNTSNGIKVFNFDVMLHVFGFLDRGTLSNVVGKVDKEWKAWSGNARLSIPLKVEELRNHPQMQEGSLLLKLVKAYQKGDSIRGIAEYIDSHMGSAPSLDGRPVYVSSEQYCEALADFCFRTRHRLGRGRGGWADYHKEIEEHFYSGVHFGNRFSNEKKFEKYVEDWYANFCCVLAGKGRWSEETLLIFEKEILDKTQMLAVMLNNICVIDMVMGIAPSPQFAGHQNPHAREQVIAQLKIPERMADVDGLGLWVLANMHPYCFKAFFTEPALTPYLNRLDAKMFVCIGRFNDTSGSFGDNVRRANELYVLAELLKFEHKRQILKSSDFAELAQGRSDLDCSNRIGVVLFNVDLDRLRDKDLLHVMFRLSFFGTAKIDTSQDNLLKALFPNGNKKILDRMRGRLWLALSEASSTYRSIALEDPVVGTLSYEELRVAKAIQTRDEKASPEIFDAKEFCQPCPAALKAQALKKELEKQWQEAFDKEQKQKKQAAPPKPVLRVDVPKEDSSAANPSANKYVAPKSPHAASRDYGTQPEASKPWSGCEMFAAFCLAITFLVGLTAISMGIAAFAQTNDVWLLEKSTEWYIKAAVIASGAVVSLVSTLVGYCKLIKPHSSTPVYIYSGEEQPDRSCCIWNYFASRHQEPKHLHMPRHDHEASFTRSTAVEAESANPSKASVSYTA